MRKSALLLIPIILAAAMLMAYYSESARMRRALESAVTELNRVAATDDKAGMVKTLGTFLTDDATVKLAVRFRTFGNPQGGEILKQDFTKPQFTQFVDNVLFPLERFGFTGNASDIEPGEQPLHATARLSAHAEGEGISTQYGLSTAMRYRGPTNCQLKVVFQDTEDGLKPQANFAECTLDLSMLPKKEDIRSLYQLPKM